MTICLLWGKRALVLTPQIVFIDITMYQPRQAKQKLFIEDKNNIVTIKAS